MVRYKLLFILYHIFKNILLLNKGKNGIEDLRGLIECPSITTLDLSENKILDENVLEEIFVKLPNLGVLYC